MALSKDISNQQITDYILATRQGGYSKSEAYKIYVDQSVKNTGYSIANLEKLDRFRVIEENIKESEKLNAEDRIIAMQNKFDSLVTKTILSINELLDSAQSFRDKIAAVQAATKVISSLRSGTNQPNKPVEQPDRKKIVDKSKWVIGG